MSDGVSVSTHLLSYNQWMLPNDAESESQAQNGGRHGLQITGQNGGDGRMDQSPYFDIIFIIIVINYHCHYCEHDYHYHWHYYHYHKCWISPAVVAAAVAIAVAVAG